MCTREHTKVQFMPPEGTAMYPQGKYCTTATPIALIGVPQLQVLYASDAQYLVFLQLELHVAIVARRELARIIERSDAN